MLFGIGVCEHILQTRSKFTFLNKTECFLTFFKVVRKSNNIEVLMQTGEHHHPCQALGDFTPSAWRFHAKRLAFER